MKKILAIITIMMVASLAFVGCSNETINDDQIKNEDQNGKETQPDEPEEIPEEEVNVPVKDILEAIKEQMKSDLIAGGVPEDNFEEGTIPGFLEQNLKPEVEEENPFFQLDINTENLEEGYILAQMINIKSDQIIVLKASDESVVSNLEAALQQVKESQIAVWEQYLPDQYEKVKNNIIKTEGKYLLYVTYENPEAIEAIFDDMLK